MAVLYFLSCEPELKDGVYWQEQRCSCPDRANFRVVVRNGKVAEHDCPVCGRECVVEVSPDGRIGCFPAGTIVL
jgi:hypothetical protein